MNGLTNICPYLRTFRVRNSLTPGPWTFQVLRTEAVGKQCGDASLLHTAISLSVSQPLLVVAGDEEDRHVLCTELADYLATHAAGRERGRNITVEPFQQ